MIFTLIHQTPPTQINNPPPQSCCQSRDRVQHTVRSSEAGELDEAETLSIKTKSGQWRGDWGGHGCDTWTSHCLDRSTFGTCPPPQRYQPHSTNRQQPTGGDKQRTQTVQPRTRLTLITAVAHELSELQLSTCSGRSLASSLCHCTASYCQAATKILLLGPSTQMK